MTRILRGILVLTLAATCFGAGAVLADQSSLQRALQNLQSARNELEQGGKDKGGLRKEALDLVNQAIEKVRKGIEHEQKKQKKN
jgi:uncharacterized phage infection (PIP) family protein YhgE